MVEQSWSMQLFSLDNSATMSLNSSELFDNVLRAPTPTPRAWATVMTDAIAERGSILNPTQFVKKTGRDTLNMTQRCDQISRLMSERVEPVRRKRICGQKVKCGESPPVGLAAKKCMTQPQPGLRLPHFRVDWWQRCVGPREGTVDR